MRSAENARMLYGVISAFAGLLVIFVSKIIMSQRP
jgi:hypothetical protein